MCDVGNIREQMVRKIKALYLTLNSFFEEDIYIVLSVSKWFGVVMDASTGHCLLEVIDPILRIKKRFLTRHIQETYC
jgi:hypothetical protein